VLHCEASAGVLHARLRERQEPGRGPSEAGIEVLESQLVTREALQPDEVADCTVVSAAGDPSGKELAARVGKLLESP
jgi:predicted kinase